MADSIAKLSVVITGDASPLNREMGRSGENVKQFARKVESGAGSLMSLSRGAQTAGATLGAMRTGNVLPLVAALGPGGGLAAVAVAATTAVGSLARQSLIAADAARVAKEEFFAQVDALEKLGANVEFARHVDRVKSLTTAWGEARQGLDRYLAAAGERTGTSDFIGGALNTFGRLATAAARGVETDEQREQRVAFNKAKRLKEEAAEQLKISKRLAEQGAKNAEDANRRAFEAVKSRLRKEAELELAAARATMEKTARLRESLRTPEERLRREMNEIMGLPLDGPTRLRALEDLKARAEGMIPESPGTPRPQSLEAIRAGSIEALRAQFSGGLDKSDKELKAAEKTAKEAEGIRTVLTRIEAAIGTTGIGVMD